MSLAALLLTLGFTVNAEAASFEGHTEFTAVSVSGQVTVLCEDRAGNGRYQRTFFCSDDILDPFEFGYFTSDDGAGADEVYLKSTREDGSQVEKSLDYDSEKGTTSGRVNLWINTLFQRALLDRGANAVSYEFRNGDAPIASGSFTATVHDGGHFECRPGFDYSGFPGSCNDPFSICRKYFRDQEYCR